MFSVSWVEIRELLAEHLAEWLDFLTQLDLIGEVRELAQLVTAAEVDANLVAAVALYVLPLAWLVRRWRRGGIWAVLGGVVRLFVLAVFLMFAVVAPGPARRPHLPLVVLSHWMPCGGVATAAVWRKGGYCRAVRRRGGESATPTTTASRVCLRSR